jgi:hypothetical protein
MLLEHFELILGFFCDPCYIVTSFGLLLSRFVASNYLPPPPPTHPPPPGVEPMPSLLGEEALALFRWFD